MSPAVTFYWLLSSLVKSKISMDFRQRSKCGTLSQPSTKQEPKTMSTTTCKIFTISSSTTVFILENLTRSLNTFLIHYLEKNVRANINIVLSIANKLRDIGRPLEVSQVVGKIISSLPEPYARVRTVWQSTPIAERTIELLQSRLIAEEKVIVSYKSEPCQNTTNAFSSFRYIL